MAAQKPYVGDIGTEIIIDVGEDIFGSATSLSVQKPDGTEAVWGASVYAINEKSQYVRHVSVAGDFSIPGEYSVQPLISTAGEAWVGRGATATFTVHDRFM